MHSYDALPWHLVGIIMMICLATLQRRISRIGPFWQIVFSLPGTILHEFSHFLVALVTGGRPSGFTVIPRARFHRFSDGSIKREWVLGSVTLRNAGALSAFPTGFAPLLLNLVALYLYRHWFSWFPRDFSHQLLMYLVIYLFCSSSVPSAQDIRTAFSNIVGVALYTAIFALGILSLRRFW